MVRIWGKSRRRNVDRRRLAHSGRPFLRPGTKAIPLRVCLSARKNIAAADRLTFAIDLTAMLTRLIDRFGISRRLRAAGRISFDDARERVRRGAAYLDGADGGWRERIDVDRLELSDGSHCVLGQLHGDFQAGLVRSRIWDGSSAPPVRLFAGVSPADLGFHARTDAGEELADLDYAFLNRAWREELREVPPAPEGVPRAVVLA